MSLSVHQPSEHETFSLDDAVHRRKTTLWFVFFFWGGVVVIFFLNFIYFYFFSLVNFMTFVVVQ